MRTAALVLGGFAFLALGWAYRKELRCAWIGRHETVRHPLGGHRCARCGSTFSTWDEGNVIGGRG